MKKIYKIAALATPITVAISSIGIYLAVTLNHKDIRVTKTNSDSAFSIENIYDHYKIFPELKQEDFYDKIKIIKGKAEIDKQMLSKIINYVFDHMEVAQGSVGYSIKRESSTTVIISFKWDSPTKIYTHDYKISLEQIQ